MMVTRQSTIVTEFGRSQGLEAATAHRGHLRHALTERPHLLRCTATQVLTGP